MKHDVPYVEKLRSALVGGIARQSRPGLPALLGAPWRRRILVVVVLGLGVLLLAGP